MTATLFPSPRPSLRRRAWRPRLGFTLIELMIVMMIMALMSLVAIPSIKGIHRRNQIAAAAREFALLARYARQEAILSNRPTEMVIDFKEDVYRLVLEVEPKKIERLSRKLTSNPKEDPRDLAKTKGRIYFQSITSSTDPFGRHQIVRIRFFKNGSASASTIVMSDADNRVMTIEITGATGNVRVYAGAPGAEDEEQEIAQGRREAI